MLKTKIKRENYILKNGARYISSFRLLRREFSRALHNIRLRTAVLTIRWREINDQASRRYVSWGSLHRYFLDLLGGDTTLPGGAAGFGKQFA
ncbi:hypothetical protein I6F26_16980 [Ensifer sp. IC3342]|nr:hypothetical protein [Ensifer sp. BRP08]MCA1448276.1 hypothetical protein [Ensifer sp. IC3342]